MRPLGRPDRRAARALAAGLALSIAPTASAQGAAPRTSSLSWTRGPGAEACIDARALSQRVEQRLRRAAIVAPTIGDIAIEGRVDRREGPASWHAIINVFDAAGARVGMRELASDRADCRALDDELGLVVSLLIDPEAAFAPASPPVARAPAPPPPPVCPPPPVAPPPPPSPWRVAAEGGFALGFGLVPSKPGGGTVFRVRVAPPVGPSFELGGAVWLDSHATLGADPATFSLAYGSAVICPLDVAAAGFTLAACAGARVGSLRVGGVGVPLAYRQEELIVDVIAEARARRRIAGPLLVALGVGLGVPTRRDRFFYVDGEGTRRDVFQAAPVAGVFDLAVGLALP